MEIITIGLFLGDEAKGSFVDFLASKFSNNVIRYNGGSQCAHNVLANGIHHTFSQFGSGTLAEIPTWISKYMLVDPLALLYESETLEGKGIIKPLEQIYISENCLVITPFQIVTGKARELARANKHGTCGKGVGETIADAKVLFYPTIKIKNFNEDDLEYRLKIGRAIKLDQIQQLEANDDLMKNFEQYSVTELVKLFRKFYKQVTIVNDQDFAKMIEEKDNIWEGAQGSLLDREMGFLPYITKTETTAKNALELLKNKKSMKMGIMRAYGTRHGQGPFPTEDKTLNLEESHNQDNEWQREFRQGHLDLVLTKYAIAINNGIDRIALSCLDKLSCLQEIKICLAYEYMGNEDQTRLKNYFNFDDQNRIIGIKVQKQDELISKLLMDCKPIYTTLPGWQTDISKMTNKKELPDEVVRLINFIEEQLAVPIDLISVGPDRSQKMFLNNDLNRGFY